ncbi:MAG TPA: ribosomal protein S18-alanine N-acetyltransferase [Terriglobales bacterium]|nr:ribosomal protein S18-alanine N-acetyltransferase [Terriglobales bacterium]
MTTRRATPADLHAIITLERESPTAAHWSQAQYDAILNAPHATERLILVCENESSLAGFVVAHTATEEWELENIVVSESNRRRGLGRKLVTALLDAARDQRARAIFLEVRESNASARALYLSCRFKETGRRPNYYDCPTEDAILYTLTVA